MFSEVCRVTAGIDSANERHTSSCPATNGSRPTQRTMDHLTRAYKEGDKFYLQGDTIPARQFIAAQARANNMIDGDEYLKVRRVRVW